MAGPSNPHKRLPTTALAERGISKDWAMPATSEGTMPDGAVIIAAITSCTNTSITAQRDRCVSLHATQTRAASRANRG